MNGWPRSTAASYAARASVFSGADHGPSGEAVTYCQQKWAGGGLTRIGFVLYNTLDEVDRVLDAIDRLR